MTASLFAFDAGPVPPLGLVPRTHTYVDAPHAHMVCTVCRAAVPYWHDDDACTCGLGTWNPCGHHAGAVTTCPSWREGWSCTCVYPSSTHRDYLPDRKRVPLWARWVTSEEATA